MIMGVSLEWEYGSYWLVIVVTVVDKWAWGGGGGRCGSYYQGFVLIVVMIMEGELGVGMWVILIRLFFGDCGHDHGGELGGGGSVRHIN